MPKLSLCMIALDEEKDLPACLKIAKPFVDEIILVDTGSTDKTKQIAEKFGAKVYDFKWVNDFSAARNFSLKKAKGDWILVLDADELVSEDDFKRLRSLMEEDADAYFLDQRNYTQDTKVFGWKPPDNYVECRGKGYSSNPLVRFFRNKKGVEFSNAIHEMIDKSLEKIGAKVSDSGIPIHHYGYLRPEDFLNQKREKYLDIGLEQIKKTPDNPRPYYEVALIYKNTGRLDEAEEHLKKVAELDPNYKLVYTNLGEIYTRKRNLKKAVECYRKSMELKPNNENAYINLSLIFFKIKRVNEAIALLGRALEKNPESATAYNNLALILIKVKDYAKAVKVLKIAFQKTGLEKFDKARLAVEKENGDIIETQEWFEQGKFDELEKKLKTQLKKKPKDVIAANNLGHVYNKQKDHKKAVELLSNFLKGNKGNGPLVINLYVNLANSYLELGKNDDAKKVIESAIALKPKGLEFLKKKLASLDKPDYIN